MSARLTWEESLGGEDFDEFAWLRDVAEEAGLPFRDPRVRRVEHEVEQSRTLSALAWGEGEPGMIFLHGGRQNAHIWDAVLQDLDRDVLVFDLPGHGRSFRRPDGDYGPHENAAALAAVLPRVAPNARTLVGMSLGALTALRLAVQMEGWVERLVLVDATPPTDPKPIDRSRAASRGVADMERLPTYPSFQALLDVAVALNPRRALPGLARETRLNARRLEDGSWTWRFDAGGRRPQEPAGWRRMFDLWEDAERIAVPTMLVRAEHSRFVSDAHEAMLRERLPGVRVDMVRASGHVVQVDQPRVLTELIRDFCAG